MKKQTACLLSAALCETMSCQTPQETYIKAYIKLVLQLLIKHCLSENKFLSKVLEVLLTLAQLSCCNKFPISLFKI